MAKDQFKMLVCHGNKGHLSREYEIDNGNPEIDEIQAHINRLLGISNEAFLMACKNIITVDSSINETQRKVNELMGVDDVTFKKYNK